MAKNWWSLGAAGGAAVAMWIQLKPLEYFAPGPTSSGCATTTRHLITRSDAVLRAVLNRFPWRWQTAELFSAGEIVICPCWGCENRLPERAAMRTTRCGTTAMPLAFSKGASGNYAESLTADFQCNSLF